MKKVNTRLRNKNLVDENTIEQSGVMTRNQYRESLSASRQNSALKERDLNISRIGDISMKDESSKSNQLKLDNSNY